MSQQKGAFQGSVEAGKEEVSGGDWGIPSRGLGVLGFRSFGFRAVELRGLGVRI